MLKNLPFLSKTLRKTLIDKKSTRKGSVDIDVRRNAARLGFIEFSQSKSFLMAHKMAKMADSSQSVFEWVHKRDMHTCIHTHIYTYVHASRRWRYKRECNTLQFAYKAIKLKPVTASYSTSTQLLREKKYIFEHTLRS